MNIAGYYAAPYRIKPFFFDENHSLLHSTIPHNNPLFLANITVYHTVPDRTIQRYTAYRFYDKYHRILQQAKLPVKKEKNQNKRR